MTLKALLVFAAVLVFLQSPVDAQEGTGRDGSSGGNVDASAEGGATPLFTVDIHDNDPTWVGVEEDPCAYDLYEYEEAYTLLASLVALAGFNPDDPPSVDDRPDLYEYPWLFVYCPSQTYGGLVLSDIFQISTEPPPPDIMLASVQGPLSIPLPEPVFSPDAADGQITGLETWLWLPEQFTATQTYTDCVGPNDYACAGISAEFVGLTFDMGDGSATVACANSRAYDLDVAYEDQADLPHCGHVYTEASRDGAYPVVVTTAWHVTWSCFYDPDLDGVREASCVGGIGTDLGFTGRTGAPVPLEVRDIQAQATSG